MSEEGGQKSKIIIDEDWKSQVQAEKQAAEEKKHNVAETQNQSATAGGEMPPASLPMLFSTLTTQALMCMGQMPDPVTGQAEVNLSQAKHFIDMLQVLDEKTSGNRTDEESRLLENLLHELRMAFVAIGRQPPTSPPPTSPASGI